MSHAEPVVTYVPVEHWHGGSSSYTCVTLPCGFSTKFERSLSRREAIRLARQRKRNAEIRAAVVGLHDPDISMDWPEQKPPKDETVPE